MRVLLFIVIFLASCQDYKENPHFKRAEVAGATIVIYPKIGQPYILNLDSSDSVEMMMLTDYKDLDKGSKVKLFGYPNSKKLYLEVYESK